jgi:hypothetical protein
VVADVGLLLLFDEVDVGIAGTIVLANDHPFVDLNARLDEEFTARLKMVDLSAPTPVTALNETWQVTVYDVGGASRPVRMFDLVTTQSCATADPLILPEYHYGGFGFRAAGAWNGPGDAARYLTSEGITDRIKGNNSRARWCFIGGPLKEGAFAGTATLGHPDNFRAPQPVRLHPNMPYFSFVSKKLLVCMKILVWLKIFNGVL